MSRIAYIIIFLAMINTGYPSCLGFFDKIKSVFLQRNHQIELTPEVVKDIETFVQNGNPNIKSVLFRNPQSNKFSFLISKIPNHLYIFLSQAKVNSRYLSEMKLKLYETNPALKETFIEIIFENMNFVARTNSNQTIVDFKDFFSKRIDEFNGLDISVKRQIQAEYQGNLLISRAFRNWEQNFNRKLTIIRKDGNKVEFQISNHRITGEIVIKNGIEFVHFNAPKTLMNHPAWNPLDFNYISQLASSARPPVKERYPVTIGLNEKLYLLDGNHRFTVDSRDFVPVEAPFPLETANIRIHLDLIGRPQPSTSQKIEILNGELDPWSLLP